MTRIPECLGIWTFGYLGHGQVPKTPATDVRPFTPSILHSRPGKLQEVRRISTVMSTTMYCKQMTYGEILIMKPKKGGKTQPVVAYGIGADRSKHA